MIREYSKQDAAAVCKLYNYFIETSLSTLDLESIDPKEFAVQCAEIKRNFPFLVYEEEGSVYGFAYANQWKKKEGYKNTLESTIYVDDAVARKGVGSQLYRALIAQLRKGSTESLVACLTLPNAASVALHEKLGFIKVGHFQRVAKKQGKQVDVGYWQLILD